MILVLLIVGPPCHVANVQFKHYPYSPHREGIGVSWGVPRGLSDSVTKTFIGISRGVGRVTNISTFSCVLILVDVYLPCLQVTLHHL